MNRAVDRTVRGAVSGVSRRAALASALLLGVGACSSRGHRERLTIATGGTGGVYYALGEALAAVMRRRWDVDVVVTRSAASIENLHLVAAGRADLGFASIDAVALAVAGHAPFLGRRPITSLALLYDDYLQFTTGAGDPIRRPADISGTAVSVGAPESGTELIVLRLLRTAGIEPSRLVRLGVADSADAMRRGEIRGFFFSGGIPTPAIAALARSSPIRLLPLGAYVPALQREYDGVYVTRTVPANTYGLDADVSTIGVHNLLVANAAMPADLAYRITKLLFESRGELAATHAEARHLHERTAVFTEPVPLHPGAVRYYREVKYGVG
ncbi:TAXI family TRAP transporter solute-binding subunit [Sphaerisporangium album]|uniref:TAXI family TRAP transporter solute-binding subunit n=1 Tax=Sphaerisporangium album TaxID=509200 RepID=UPI0015F017CB|nr:TAXI family TRAP transporter solute-binding subunit [Sphaerisporangium album]